MTTASLHHLRLWLATIAMAILLQWHPVQSIQTRYMHKGAECAKAKVYEADQKFLRLQTIGKSGRKFPVNYKELASYCSENTRLLNDVEKFLSTCYKPEVLNLAKVGIFSVKRLLRQFCGKKKRTKKLDKLLEVAGCMNTVIDQIPCLDMVVQRNAELIKYKIENEKITHTCCNIVAAYRCTDDYLGTLDCMNDSGRELANEFLRLSLNDMTNVMCGEYNESTDKCDSVKWPPPASKKDPKIKIDDKLKSMVFMALELIQSIETFNTEL